MLGLIRGGIIGAIVCLSFAACGGDDFSSDETGKSDASVGGTSASGGTAGSSTGGAAGVAGNPVIDAAPEAPGNCDLPLAQTQCGELSTGVPACDSCGTNACCTQIETCLANDACSKAMKCYLDNCFDQDTTACMLAFCQPCINQGVTPFLGMSECLLDNCGGPAGLCPQFKN